MQRFKHLFKKVSSVFVLFLLTYTITLANSFFDLAVTSTDVSCDGTNDGTATATPLNGWAPFTYSWSNGATTSTITDLTPGYYEVTVVSSDLAIQVGGTTVGQSSGMQLFLSASYETCVGSNDASASVNVSGGNGALSYLWSTGETFVVASDLSAGTYSVTVTDEAGCTATGSIDIELSPEGVWIMGSSTDANCGENNGTAYVSVMTGVAPFTIVWSDGQTGPNATGLAPGTYGVTVTDSNGCTNSENLEVGAEFDLSISISGTNTECGLSNGSATVTVDGNGSYQYSWSNGANTPTINNLSPGTYSVTVEDNNGCSDVTSISIEEETGLTLDIVGTNGDCDINNGTAAVSASGGNGTYIYSWSNGAGTSSISNLSAGTYSVTVLDSNGCSEEASISIEIGSDINLTISGTDSECNANNGTAGVVATGGNGNYSYFWSNGANTANINNLSTGTYSVTVEDNNGCSSVASISIDEEPGLDLNISGVDGECGTDNGSASVSVTGGNGNYLYSWNNGANTASISNLGAGTYSVSVQDTNGCSSDATITITSGASINLDIFGTDSECNANTGSAQVSVTGGTAPFSYQWSNGTNTANISNLSAGDYLVTVEDSNGCSSVASITIGEEAGLMLNITGVDGECGVDNGSASVSATGGNGMFSYSWSNGSNLSNITNLGAGTYSVTVTDSNGCSEEASVTIDEGSELILNITSTESDCNANNGTANAILSGGSAPYIYSWSNGASTSSLNSLSPGNYTLTVEDDNGCLSVASVTLGEAPGIALNISGTDGECGIPNGSAAVSVSGGNGSYLYAWSNGANTASISNLSAGAYTVTVTDTNGCSNEASLNIEIGSAVNLTVSGTDGVCGTDNGFASASATGGSGSYIYSWSNGASTTSITNLGAGTYSLTVTDTNGCTDEASISIAVGPAVSLSINSIDAGCNTNDGSATVTINSGTAPYTYLWNNGSTSSSINGLASGEYSVTVSDAINCTATGSVTISGIIVDGGTISTSDLLLVCADDGNDDIVNTTLTGNIGENSIYVFTTTDGEILGLGTAPPFNFEGAGVGTCLIWHLSYQDGLTGLVIGQNVADLIGCYHFSNSLSITREDCCIVMGGTITSDSNNTICAGDGEEDLINVSLTGAVGTEQAWLITSLAGDILGLPNSPPFNLEGAGEGVCLIWSISYEPGLTGLMMGANVANLDGCYELSSSSIEVVRYDSPILSLTATDAACNNEASGSINTTVSGGTAPYSYSWSNGSTSSDLSNLEAGTYSLTIVDSNGCSDVVSATIGEPSAIVITFDGGDETCESSNGFASVSATGGTPGYTYLWSNGATTATINGLSAGTYGVTVTDANGCTVSDANAVTLVNTGINSCSASITSSYNEGVDISAFGGSDGSATVSGNGGILPYSFAWSNGETGSDINGLSAGTYSVIITDAIGCTCESSVTLNDPSKIGNFVWEDLNRNGIQDGGEPGLSGITINLNGTTAVGNVTRTTATDSNGGYSFDGLPAGNYKVTFSGGNLKSSPLNAGSDSSIDSDVNPESGMTEYFDLGVAECNNDVDAGFYECVNIGDFVFYDGNRDGIQQPWEAGVQNVLVRLMNFGPDGIYCTNDDVLVNGIFTENDGRYLFECVEPGTYYIDFQINTQNYEFTDQDEGGNDELDSDADPITGKTDPFVVLEGQNDDLSFDAGIYLFCDDFSTGGQIGSNQELCPGETADPLTSISLPGGGYGNAEYLWMRSNSGGSLTNGSWIEIPNSDSPTYSPGQVYSTTYYIRCARRENCDNFVAESNVVVIVVNPCFSGLIQNLTANIIARSEISIEWSTDPEFDLYMYHIERSHDGNNFQEIGTTLGQGNNTNMNHYQFMDYTPRMGRNVYRIMRMDMLTGNLIYSNEVEVMFNPTEERFFVYPNPTTHTLFVESLYNMNGNATLELYTSTGKLLETIEVDEQLGKASINFNRYAAGPYFIKVKFEGKDKIDVIRIIKD